LSWVRLGYVRARLEYVKLRIYSWILFRFLRLIVSLPFLDCCQSYKTYFTSKLHFLSKKQDGLPLSGCQPTLISIQHKVFHLCRLRPCKQMSHLAVNACTATNALAYRKFIKLSRRQKQERSFNLKVDNSFRRRLFKKLLTNVLRPFSSLNLFTLKYSSFFKVALVQLEYPQSHFDLKIVLRSSLRIPSKVFKLFFSSGVGGAGKSARLL